MDNLSINELIRQAQAQKERWERPKRESKPTFKTWQEMLDRPYGRIENKY